MYYISITMTCRYAGLNTLNHLAQDGWNYCGGNCDCAKTTVAVLNRLLKTVPTIIYRNQFSFTANYDLLSKTEAGARLEFFEILDQISDDELFLGASLSVSFTDGSSFAIEEC